jgi:hypothetical protein
VKGAVSISMGRPVDIFGNIEAQPTSLSAIATTIQCIVFIVCLSPRKPPWIAPEAGLGLGRADPARSFSQRESRDH